MDEAHQLATVGAAHGTAVAARVQGAGRGRRGRSWASPEGGLWLSVICRPGDAAGAGCLSLRTGLAVADTIERLFPAVGGLQLKWPNDVLLDGRKLAGVLCEARWDGAEPVYVIVGIGVNVANAIPFELVERAVALGDRVPGASPAALAQPIAEAIAVAGRVVGPLSEHERARWTARDWLLGKPVSGAVSGTGAGIAADGALLVCQPSGAIGRIAAGDVTTAGRGPG